MPQKPDTKVVRAWASLLGKDESHIRRLIKSGKLENRYPRPNEGLPVPDELKGKIPLPRNFVAVDVGRRKKPSKKSLEARLDGVLGTKGSEREKLWQNVFAIFDDPELTSNQVEAVTAGFEVMAASAKKPSKLNEILTAAVERCRRRTRRKPSRLSKGQRKAKNRTFRKPFSAHSRFFAVSNVDDLSERDLRRMRSFAEVMQRAVDEASQKPKTEKWTQVRIAKELGMSKSGYRKFLQRTGLGHASRAAQLNQSTTGRLQYTGLIDHYADEESDNYNAPQ